MTDIATTDLNEPDLYKGGLNQDGIYIADGVTQSYDEATQTFVDEEVIASYSEIDIEELKRQNEWCNEFHPDRTTPAEIEASAQKLKEQHEFSLLANEPARTPIMFINKIDGWGRWVWKIKEILGEASMAEAHEIVRRSLDLIRKTKKDVDMESLFPDGKIEQNEYVRFAVLYFSANGPDFYEATAMQELTPKEQAVLTNVRQENFEYLVQHPYDAFSIDEGNLKRH